MNNRLINTKVAGGGGGCTDIVDNYDPFGGNGVALYQLNGDATDVSGNYDGNFVNPAYTTGVFGQAASFNGSSSYIDIPAFNQGSQVSVSFWLNKSSGGEAVQVIADKRTSSANNFYIYHYLGEVGFQVRNSSGTGWVLSVATTVGVWDFYTMTFGSGTLRIYKNGQFISQDTTAVMDSTNNTMKIGRVNDNIVYNLLGSLDQFRIFNTALTPLEVEALYTEELCICDGTVDTLQVLGGGDTSCIATYQLDGNANDLSGNYSGTPINVSYGVGEFDLAGVFNGNGSYITIPQGNLPVGASARTVSIWINTTQTALAELFGYGVDGNNLYYAVNINAAANTVGTAFYANDHNFSASVIDGAWHHIVSTYDGNTVTMYVDGQSVGSATAGAVNTGSGGVPEIGKYNYTGSIDQVRIFNKALNSTEVETLWLESACTKAACTGTTNTLDILGDGRCVAAYPLDGSPADLSGNYNGVQTDVTYPQGYFDLAGAFNGSSSVIRDIPNSISTSLKSNNAFTYSFWIKFNSLGSQSIIQFFNDVTSAVSFNGTNFTAYIYNSSVQQREVTNSASVTTGVWYNVVFKGDSNGIFLYVNNNTPASTSWGGDWFIYTNATYKYNAIGARQNSGGFTEYVDGEIDQVRIFNKALSAGEVTTLYNETPCN